jgi:hypothetical protein
MKISIVHYLFVVAAGFLTSTLASAEAAADAAVKDTANTTTFVGKDSTSIDFSAANIDGKTQAPSGFFLQGRNSQSMSQMVKLRSKFRSELRDSKSAVKALIH